MAWKAHFDGGSRGNPGVAGAGAALYDDGGRLIWRGAEPLGERTNNEAEYMAAILALKEVVRRGLNEIELCGDSKLVINQLSGAWKIKEPRLGVLAEEFNALAKGLSVRFRWVPRKDNSEADRMANLAMDGLAPSDDVSSGKDETSSQAVVEIVVFSDGDGRYFVDLPRLRCSCEEFASRGDCVHLKICRDAGFTP
ncbi:MULTISPECIES: ribonuclease HI family protein [Dethiosulfovibrio]|jgi:ribonuclease HI|uniref:Ribonuclease HI family protein n=2 Tax=Dethiosulfovibrio TaxID=47054 RepID=A0ABS9EN37_9BACT|nr:MULTISPECIES: ribonuclease HI family protein [Dethiosulfovibrio]MCF4114207.1 ribonuclease HI family protein [Dethiosulfovibrio russensis]MCF4142603.1 ribonuclease HI family protein [Dethiosulfovibrio marinus]MCF4145122.1 ribonuclease HI family protein [Dethiosulfovibrio acidaminovorans]